MLRPRRNILTALLSKLYGGITEGRNWLFEKDILKSQSFNIPIISVGNLSVGGTGKTPHIEYLIRLLSKDFNVAVLSRGYRRKTKGFIVADAMCSASDIGDEPFQIYSKFSNIKIAVDEKRVNGIEQLAKRCPELQVILLDDAYQHRYVNPGISILLTDLSNPYSEDQMLPCGYLREKPNNSYRADIVIVTKCPADLNVKTKKRWLEKLTIQPHQELFFSTFSYDAMYPLFYKNESIPHINSETTAIILTGIERPEPMIEFVEQSGAKIIKRIFPDHHQFTRSELEEIESLFKEIPKNKLIITTEKDAARLKSNSLFSENIKKCIFVLPIKVQLLNNEQEIFNKKIKDYVRENSRNS